MNEYIILKGTQVVCTQTYFGITSVLAYCQSLNYNGSRYTLVNIDTGMHYNFNNYLDLRVLIKMEK